MFIDGPVTAKIFNKQRYVLTFNSFALQEGREVLLSTKNIKVFLTVRVAGEEE